MKEQHWVVGRGWNSKGRSMQFMQGHEQSCFALQEKWESRGFPWTTQCMPMTLRIKQRLVLGWPSGSVWPTFEGYFLHERDTLLGNCLSTEGFFAFLSFPWFCLTNTRNCENTASLYWIEIAWGYRWGKANTCLLPAPLHCNTVNGQKGRIWKPDTIFYFWLQSFSYSPFTAGLLFVFLKSKPYKATNWMWDGVKILMPKPPSCSCLMSVTRASCAVLISQLVNRHIWTDSWKWAADST